MNVIHPKPNSQFILAVIALIGVIVCNVMGVESETLNYVLITLIGVFGWGGVQALPTDKVKSKVDKVLDVAETASLAVPKLRGAIGLFRMLKDRTKK